MARPALAPRGRAHRARDHQPALSRSHAPHRPATGCRRLDAEDQGHRDPAGPRRAHAGSNGPGCERPAFRRRAQPLPQHAQDHDLRRLERDPAQHHREEHPWVVKRNGRSMNFDYNEEQQLLADSVRRYLGKSYDFEARKRIVAGEGWSAEAWSQLAQLGLMGLPMGAEHGGFGGGAVDLMGVMEAFGDALVVEPYVAHVLAARLIERGGSSAQQGALLPSVVEGRAKLAVAHAEKGARFALDAVQVRSAKGRLSGEKNAVIGAPVADRLVVSARSDAGIGLYLVERSAVEIKPYRTVDERHVSQEAVQLHGGMGMSEELKVSHTFRRLMVLAREYGDADHHLARLAAL